MHARSAASTVVLLLAAAIGNGALGPVYGGRVTVALADLPARFDPAPARGAAARLIAALVHERLVDLGDGVPRPALAESWSAGASGREFAIRLRAGAAFHDGTALGSADVVRSLRRFLRSPSAAAAELAARIEGGAAFRDRGTEDLPGLVAAGPFQVALRLRERSATVLATLAAADAAITSVRGAGAGPFVPTTASPILGRASFVAFPGHVRGRPFLDGVTVHVAGVAGEDAGHPKVSPAIGPGPLAASLLLVLDPAHPAFARVEQRRAVAAAVDGDDLVRNFLPGGATTVSPIPPVLLPALPRAGPALHPRPAPASVALAVSSDVPVLVSQRVVASLGAVGLQATAVAADPDIAWTTRAAARLVAWTPEVPDALMALHELAGRAPGEGRDILARAGREADEDRRAALIHRVESALRDRWIIIPLAALPLGYRSAPGLHGITVDKGGRLRLENAWIAP